METFAGRREARIARLRLVEFYRQADPPLLSQAVSECRAAISAFPGTPEEGVGHMLMADLLACKGEYSEAFAEYERVIREFSAQPYAPYARVRYALALCDGGDPEGAKVTVEPVLEDPVWGGRAHYARGFANLRLGLADAAIVDFERAAQGADSLWFRSESRRELARLLAERGQLPSAISHLKRCLDEYPLRKDMLDIRLEIVRSLSASGKHLAAAQAVLALKLDLLNSP